jgi:hypothetical protein
LSQMGKTEEYSIYSERFKREVDKAHRDFFERRGIPIRSLDGDLLFGSKEFRGHRANNPLLSQYENDLPISQSYPRKSYMNPPY